MFHVPTQLNYGNINHYFGDRMITITERRRKRHTKRKSLLLTRVNKDSIAYLLSMNPEVIYVDEDPGCTNICSENLIVRKGRRYYLVTLTYPNTRNLTLADIDVTIEEIRGGKKKAKKIAEEKGLTNTESSYAKPERIKEYIETTILGRKI